MSDDKGTFYKDDIIARAAELSSIKEEALKADPKLLDKAYEAITAAIQDSVAKGRKVRLTGFGSWALAHKPARTARNPRTGEPVEVDEAWKVRFKAAAGFEGLARQTQKATKP
ncbi:HU family DNA-binding protein [Streptosporangium sp. CA-135522]|uniref:HU family DNA-binding protein n=1 Tax=Streptosporangium sp. CA-135522 TaxID=3240072 RepID=UPI003D8AC520